MKKTINYKGTIHDLTKPLIMGILNCTPDSFFSGSRAQAINEVVEKATKMVFDGVDIIDIGGYSTRPNADVVSEEEELRRVIEPIRILREKFPDTLLSIDTFRAEVAKQAVEAGAGIINDVSGGNLDPKMFETVAQLQVPYILMHMRGTPQTMSGLCDYNNVVEEVISELQEKVCILKKLGVHDIIIDPGFGFAKTIEQNYEVLKNLELFSVLEYPVLVGLSRKSMIYKPLNISPEDSLEPTLVLNFLALNKKARILRVHDVKEAKQLITLFNLL